MIATNDLPKPPATPASAIAALLGMKEPSVWTTSSTFTTIDFIGRFHLTALEGHNRLNELVQDGLLSARPESDTESWQVTREGTYVLSPRKKRVTKKLLLEATACLKSIGPELMRQGAVELSMGGRPVDGKPNGHLLIGLRLKHRPFDAPVDHGILLQLCSALGAAVGQDVFEVMLFSEKVPFRLKHRTVVIAREDGSVASGVGAPEVIDEDEAEQSAWRKRFCEMHDYNPNDMLRNLRQRELPSGVVNSLQIAAFSEPHPLEGATSKRPPDDEAVVRFCLAHCPDPSQIESYWLKRYPKELFATLEYKAATLTLSRLCERLARDGCPDDDSAYVFYPLMQLARREGGVHRAAALVLINYRSMLKAQREQSVKAAQTKKPLVPNYWLFFDTLNFPAPELVGFVRQPAGHGAYVDELMEEWDGILRHFETIPATVLALSGYPVGRLSLDGRPATEEEKTFYDNLCIEKGSGFRYILFMPNGQMACRKRDRFSFERVEIPTPPLFLAAQLGRPVRPRLVSPWAEMGHTPISEVIQSTPPTLRSILESNVVSLKTTSMQVFARHAALKPCIDPVVLASGLLDAWTFTSSYDDRWGARAGRDEWAVVLDAGSRDLQLTVSYGTLTEKYVLAPFQRENRRGRMQERDKGYDDTLEALMPFLDAVRDWCTVGLRSGSRFFRSEPEQEDDLVNLRRLSRALCFALHGDGSSWGLVSTDWPYFPATVEEGEDEAED